MRQRDANLTFVLEAADARTVARARVDDDVRALLRIDRDALRRDDLQQQIVDGPLQFTAVDNDVVFIDQHRRAIFGDQLLVEGVADLPHDVEEQHHALREIGRVGAPVLHQLFGVALLRPDVAQRRRGLRVGDLRRVADLLRIAAPSVDNDCDSVAAADMRAARRSLFSSMPNRRSGALKEAKAPAAAGAPGAAGDGNEIWFICDPLFVLVETPKSVAAALRFKFASIRRNAAADCQATICSPAST